MKYLIAMILVSMLHYVGRQVFGFGLLPTLAAGAVFAFVIIVAWPRRGGK